VVLAVEVEELEGHHLSQSVVDVIERIFEDVGLGEPARPFGHPSPALLGFDLVGRVFLFEGAHSASRSAGVASDWRRPNAGTHRR
jgi:hypothetical protein